MARKYSSKINKIRTFALSLVFIGFFVMYIGIFFQGNMLVMTLFMLLGLLCIVGSTVVFFLLGMSYTKTVQGVLPNIGDQNKNNLGGVKFMYCNEPLTMDPSLEGKEFNEDYNSKKKADRI